MVGPVARTHWLQHCGQLTVPRSGFSSAEILLSPWPFCLIGPLDPKAKWSGPRRGGVTLALRCATGEKTLWRNSWRVACLCDRYRALAWCARIAWSTQRPCRPLAEGWRQHRDRTRRSDFNSPDEVLERVIACEYIDYYVVVGSPRRWLNGRFVGTGDVCPLTCGRSDEGMRAAS